MALFWFFAGILFALAVLILITPWLRTIPGLAGLPAIPWQAGIAAVIVMAAVVGLYQWNGHSDAASAAKSAPFAAANGASSSASALRGAADALRGDAGGLVVGGKALAAGASSGGAMTNANAGSMNSAISSLQARLAKGGGTPADWDLLAKSYEFLNRPDEAKLARAHQLPKLPADDGAAGGPAGLSPSMGMSAPAATQQSGGAAQAATSGTVVNVEVSLAQALSGKAAAGATLFVLAKSVDSPGPPVAVIRGQVGTWPQKFALSDAQSMVPGRNLSSVGRVTIEARISLSGQPMPAAGDLQGTSDVIKAGDRAPLKITIDKVLN